MLQEAASNPPEDKPCICDKTEVGNCGTTVAEIRWFFFFFRLIKVDHLEKQTPFQILVIS